MVEEVIDETSIQVSPDPGCFLMMCPRCSKPHNVPMDNWKSHIEYCVNVTSGFRLCSTYFKVTIEDGRVYSKECDTEGIINDRGQILLHTIYNSHCVIQLEDAYREDTEPLLVEDEQD